MKIEVRMVFESREEMLAELGQKAQQAVEAPPTPTAVETTEQPAPEKPARRTRAKKSDPAKEPEPETPSEPESKQPDPSDSQTKPITADDVRAALMAVNEAKGMPAAKAVLQQFGVDRVSSVPEDKYAEFVAACDKGVT